MAKKLVKKQDGGSSKKMSRKEVSTNLKTQMTRLDSAVADLARIKAKNAINYANQVKMNKIDNKMDSLRANNDKSISSQYRKKGGAVKSKKK